MDIGNVKHASQILNRVRNAMHCWALKKRHTSLVEIMATAAIVESSILPLRIWLLMRRKASEE